LPDLKAWDREFGDVVGEGFAIQGVEAALDGTLVEIKGRLMLQLAGNSATLRLEPLKQKVQMDPDKRQPQPATTAEKEAYKRLAARWAEYKGPAPRVRITGPLRAPGQDAVPILTIREYTWE
jgi:hypothetical protein